MIGPVNGSRQPSGTRPCIMNRIRGSSGKRLLYNDFLDYLYTTVLRGDIITTCKSLSCMHILMDECMSKV